MNYKKYKNINIFATHGAADHEKVSGQKFVLEITIFGKNLKELCEAILDDDIEKIVIEEGIEAERDLIQTVSGRIADKILAKYTKDILEVRVEVKKPSTSIRIGKPGGLVKYVATTVSKRQEGYSLDSTSMEAFNYTNVKSARFFNKNVKYEVDLEVAFPMEDSIREDDIAYSYSYTTIYDVAIDTIKNNIGDNPGELLEKMIETVYSDNPKTQRVRATIRNYIPENNLSADYTEYQMTK